MFNINLDLKEAGDLLKSPLGAILFCFAFAFVFILIGMSLSSKTKQQVCKEELILVKLQEKQIEDLEIEYSKCVSNGETSCIEREQRICRKEKEDIKKNCDVLLDQVLRSCENAL